MERNGKCKWKFKSFVFAYLLAIIIVYFILGNKLFYDPFVTSHLMNYSAHIAYASLLVVPDEGWKCLAPLTQHVIIVNKKLLISTIKNILFIIQSLVLNMFIYNSAEYVLQSSGQ